MATHSSIFAWRIAWTEKPSRLPSMVSQRVGHDSSNLAHHIFYSPLHCTQSRPVKRTRAGFASAFASWGRNAGLSFLCHPRWGWEERRATGLGFDGVALACSLAPSSGASKFQPPLCIWDPPGDPWGNPPPDISVFWTEKNTTVHKAKQQQPRGRWFKDDLLILSQIKWEAATQCLSPSLPMMMKYQRALGKGRPRVFGNPSGGPQLACLWPGPCRDFSLGQCFFKKQ